MSDPMTEAETASQAGEELDPDTKREITQQRATRKSPALSPSQRHCQNPDCGKPLGSTHRLCHTCGGKSYRGTRQHSMGPMPILPGVTAGLKTLFDRRGGA